MKLSPQKKILGLALGERSLLAAQVSASQRPKVERTEEFVYPADLSLANPAALGTALAKFLKEKEFSARVAIVGLPVRWLVVKQKSVPPITGSTLADLLRLEAESEFSSDLKDLVYEFVEPDAKPAAIEKNVLLLATQQKNIDAIAEMCDTAKINLTAVMPSAVALCRAMGVSAESELLVLSLSQSGSEITAQQGAALNGMRHMRSAAPQTAAEGKIAAAEGKPAAFVSELRRMLMTLPAGSNREMVLWNGLGSSGPDAQQLSQQLGLPVRAGDISGLGVDPSSGAALNGQSHKFAAAVALGTLGLSGDVSADFLHSRLAPPKPNRLPRWTFLAGGGGILVIAIIVMAVVNMQSMENQLSTLQDSLTQAAPNIATDNAFVNKVAVAWQWHPVTPRYLTCWRDLTLAIPQDGTVYLASMSLNEEESHVSNAPNAPPPAQALPLAGVLDGRAPDQSAAVRLVDMLNRNHFFKDAKLVNTSPIPRQREVTFQITFLYDVNAPEPQPATAKGQPTTNE